MFKNNNWSLVRQLSLGAFALIVLVLALVLFVSGYKTSDIMLRQMAADQQRIVEVVAAQLDAIHSSFDKRTKRLADALSSLYPDNFEFDRSTKMQIGDYQAPLVFHHGELVNLNFGLVDRIASFTGGNATIFIRYQDDFLRVTTSLKNLEGHRAVGTLLGKSHPGYRMLMNGEVYIGEASLFGTSYMTRYTPVKGDSGETEAILYVGLPMSDVMSELRKDFLSLMIGETGYLGLVDLDDPWAPEKLIIHRTAHGKSFRDVYGTSLKGQMDRLFSDESGVVEFVEAVTGREASLRFQRTGEGKWLLYTVSYRDEFTGPVHKLLWIVAWICLVAAVLLVLTLGLLLRKGLHPIGVMRDVLHKIGQGDLTHRFPRKYEGKTNNELFQLETSLNDMLDKFGKAIESVHNVGEKITHSSASIAQLSGNMQRLSCASHDEAVQVSVAIRQMAIAIEEVSASASAVAQDANITSELSESGNGVMSSVVSRVENLQQEFQQAVTAVEQLRNDSTAIGKVVDVISSVAEQTNLLALNAAIEAARAGEQGRGFAVVADEVRTLAQRTQESTQEIQQVVATLQENAVKASGRMEDGVVQIGDCVKEVERGRDVLTKIRAAAEEVSSQMESVASATEEQSTGATQISSSSETQRASAEQTAQCAEANAAEGERLSRQALELRNQVESFRV
ncbi:MAG: hypothetical protein CSA50_05975 [Gammaproteobacteria bacterium]|nr:MAG: hypothetical protein CSA50_05975 [Gammaproteobacteria bacterium]